MLLLTLFACADGDGPLGNKDRFGDDSVVTSDDSSPPDPPDPTTGFAPSPVQWDVPDEAMGGSGLYTFAQSYYAEGFWSLLDLNGDARPDLVVTAPGSNDGTEVFGNGGDAHWRVYWNNGAGFDAAPSTWDVPDDAPIGDAGLYTTAQSYYAEGFWSLLDLTADGRPDLVITAPASSNGTEVFDNGGDPHWRVYVNTGAGFRSSASDWSVPDEAMGGAGFYTTTQSYYSEGFWTLLDLVGDGTPDLVVTAPGSSDGTEVFGNGGDARWRVYAGGSAGFSASPSDWDVPDEAMGGAGFYTTAQSYYAEGFWSTTDLDGDGDLDLVVMAPSSSNGTEVFGYGDDAHWRVYAGGSAGFSASPSDWDVTDEAMGGAGFYTMAQSYYAEGFWATTDLNRDGQVDLVVTAPGNRNGTAVFDEDGDAYWRVYAGAAGGFMADPATWDVPNEAMGGAGFYTMAQSYYAEGFWGAMDLDGDGGLDLVVTAPGSSSGTEVFGNGGDAYWQLYRGQ